MRKLSRFQKIVSFSLITLRKSCLRNNLTVLTLLSLSPSLVEDGFLGVFAQHDADVRLKSGHTKVAYTRHTTHLFSSKSKLLSHF